MVRINGLRRNDERSPRKGKATAPSTPSTVAGDSSARSLPKRHAVDAALWNVECKEDERSSFRAASSRHAALRARATPGIDARDFDLNRFFSAASATPSTDRFFMNASQRSSSRQISRRQLQLSWGVVELASTAFDGTLLMVSDNLSSAFNTREHAAVRVALVLRSLLGSLPAANVRAVKMGVLASLVFADASPVATTSAHSRGVVETLTRQLEGRAVLRVTDPYGTDFVLPLERILSRLGGLPRFKPSSQTSPALATVQIPALELLTVVAARRSALGNIPFAELLHRVTWGQALPPRIVQLTRPIFPLNRLTMGPRRTDVLAKRPAPSLAFVLDTISANAVVPRKARAFTAMELICFCLSVLIVAISILGAAGRL